MFFGGEISNYFNPDIVIKVILKSFKIVKERTYKI